MGTSLQQGIEAAKAGKLSLALEYLKNALVEEPKNPEVWIWLSGIISDEEKQLIFLKKALELDPDNSAAQRGLAYLQRQKYVPSQIPISENKLATAKSSQTGNDPEPEYPDPDYLTAHVETFAKQVEALGDPQAPSREEIIRQSKSLISKPKKPILEILIYVFTLIVFTVIGVLIGVTIKNRQIPVAEPTATVQRSEKTPGEGVYLSVDNLFYEMELGKDGPPVGSGIPSTMAGIPKIVVHKSVLVPDNLKFINEKEQAVEFIIEEVSDNSLTIVPVNSLSAGQYCLIHPIADESQAFYWCFKVVE